jgi:hypothetical protein
MRKIKLLSIILSIFVAVILMLASNAFAGTGTGELGDAYAGGYKLTITSEGLPESVRVDINPHQGFAYVNDGLEIYSDFLYGYQLKDDGGNDINTLNGEPATILISKGGLVEGTTYDVYYFDEQVGDDWWITYSIDESLNGTQAEVVEKEDGKLYIQLTTTSLKKFALNQHMSSTYETALEEITKDGVYELNAADPTDYEYFPAFAYFTAVNNMGLGYSLEPIYGNSTSATSKSYAALSFDDIPNEKHIVEYQYKYDEIDSKIKALIDEITEACKDEGAPSLMKWFTVEDLSYINYLNSYASEETLVYYSSELKDTFKDSNFIPYFDYQMGDAAPFNLQCGGFITVFYNGDLYPLGFDGGYTLKQVIYVPSDTENSDAALIAAAKERIANYLGIDESEVILTVAGTRESLDTNWDNYDEANISDNYYNLEINGQIVDIVIERNSDKATELEFKTRDILTEVEINSKSGSIPFDTAIEVSKLASGTEYDKIMRILELTESEMFNLDLHSNSLDVYIAGLETGAFEVKIPISDAFKGKDLVVYYVDEDNNKVEHPVTVEGDYAIFTTDHFSIYTLAEKVAALPEQEAEPSPTPETEDPSTPAPTPGTEEPNTPSPTPGTPSTGEPNTPVPTPATEEPDAKDTSPKTGDINILLIVITSTLAIIGIVAVAKIRNKTDKEI